MGAPLSQLRPSESPGPGAAARGGIPGRRKLLETGGQQTRQAPNGERRSSTSPVPGGHGEFCGRWHKSDEGRQGEGALQLSCKENPLHRADNTQHNLQESRSGDNQDAINRGLFP